MRSRMDKLERKLKEKQERIADIIYGFDKLRGDIREKFPYCSSEYQKFLRENNMQYEP